MSENREVEMNGAEAVGAPDILALTDAIDVATDAPKSSSEAEMAVRPTRPKSKRRARVLDAEQVAASRRVSAPEPTSPQPTRFRADPPKESGSKLSAFTDIVSQVKSRFAKDAEERKERAVQSGAHTYSTPEPRKASVLEKAKEKWSTVAGKADTGASDQSFGSDFDQPMPTNVAPKAGLLARFDTAVMGVAAGVFVSGVALMMVSVVLA